MNVKSKFDVEYEENNQRSEYMRAGCGAPYSMIFDATRLDVSNIHAPKFIQKLFQALGWKTKLDGNLENRN